MLIAPQIPMMPVANLMRLVPIRVKRAGRSASKSMANMPDILSKFYKD